MEGTTKIKEGPLILEFYTELRMGFTLYEMILAGKKLKKMYFMYCIICCPIKTELFLINIYSLKVADIS